MVVAPKALTSLRRRSSSLELVRWCGAGARLIIQLGRKRLLFRWVGARGARWGTSGAVDRCDGFVAAPSAEVWLFGDSACRHRGEEGSRGMDGGGGEGSGRLHDRPLPSKPRGGTTLQRPGECSKRILHHYSRAARVKKDVSPRAVTPPDRAARLHLAARQASSFFPLVRSVRLLSPVVVTATFSPAPLPQSRASTASKVAQQPLFSAMTMNSLLRRRRSGRLRENDAPPRMHCIFLQQSARLPRSSSSSAHALQSSARVTVGTTVLHVRKRFWHCRCARQLTFATPRSPPTRPTFSHSVAPPSTTIDDVVASGACVQCLLMERTWYPSSCTFLPFTKVVSTFSPHTMRAAICKPLPPSLTVMDDLFGSSCSSASSTATVQHHKVRSFSTNSLSSVGSFISRRYHGETTPRSTSALNLTLPLSSRRWSGSSNVVQPFQADGSAHGDHRGLRLVDVAESADETQCGLVTELSLHGSPSGTKKQDEGQADISPQAVSLQQNEAEDENSSPLSPSPVNFRKWVNTLRRKKAQKPVHVTPRDQRWTLDDFEASNSPSQKQYRPSQHRKQGSYSSSVAFVTAVRSATATLASASVATVSRRNSKWRRAQRSSLISGSEARPSMETQRSVMDDAARARSRKRRERIEELIRTEEGYVADLKALSNALYTILGYQPDSQSSARNRACVDVSPSRIATGQHVRSEATVGGTAWMGLCLRGSTRLVRDGHDGLSIFIALQKTRRRWRRCAIRRSWSPSLGYRSDVDFDGYMKRSDYDSAIETLAYTINPVQSRDANKRKALTVKDLLIKPIQRLPRYELLFSDLWKLTPVCDDPDCHATLQKLLVDINQACQLMNQAKDDHSALRVLEVTWLIGERLTFSGQVPRSVFLKLLGQVMLCGCLHIAYRTRERVRGCYVICILFETTLLLAVAPEDQQRYSTLAGIALANATIADCDDMKGLQCYTAPHSWKLVFEHSARMYEVIFTACSAPEKDAWIKRISDTTATQSQAVAEGTTNAFELQSPIVTEMRSIGRAFGKPGSFVRRMSVRRAATVGPTTDLNQVIIKNTQAVKEALDNNSTASLPIGRSQTVAGPSQVQTLAPRRADRVRLEALLSDVWSKEALPYPGMTMRRTEDIRASANNVMRKFSMASIASNFSTSKRNASYTSISSARHNNSKEDSRSGDGSRATSRKHRRHARAPLVDFHNAPDAFLPEDFGLEDPTKRKRSALRTLTMNMERPFTPLLGENRPVALRRTQSVRDGQHEVIPVSTRGGLEGAGHSAPPPVYSVVQEAGDGGVVKTPRKSKSRNKLLKIFKESCKEAYTYLSICDCGEWRCKCILECLNDRRYGLQSVVVYTLRIEYNDAERCRDGSMSASKDAKTQILWGRKFGLERRGRKAE
ncbi:hypothetical protein KC361_g73 [Hortaea werneckii]|nr:hypothetical protein KC361_g73 [Hortaea werneckii]